MQKSQQSRSRFKASSWHILVLVYCLALGALVALIFIEKQQTSIPVSMTHASYAESRASKVLLSLHGERIHDNVRILHAADMIDDRALQWEILPGATVQAVAVKEEFALAACFRNKLVSVDLSTPGGPTLLDSLQLPGYINGITIIGNRALVGMRRGGGMVIVDIGRPEDLQLQAHFPMQGSVVDMVPVDDHVYFINNYSGLGRISLVGENSSPKILDELNRPWRIAVSDDRLAVSSQEGNLFFYDLSQGDMINKVGALKLSGFEKGGIRGLAFSAESLVIALSDRSMRIFPLTSWPRLEDYSSLPVPGMPFRLMPIPGRHKVAVSLVSAGIALVDITPSRNAVVSGHHILPMTNIAMDVTGDTVYVSGQGERQGLIAIDIERIEQSTIKPALHVDRRYYALYAWNGRLFGYRRDKVLVALTDAGQCGSSTSGPILSVHDKDGVSIFRMQENGEVSMAGSIVMETWVSDAFYADGHLYVLHRDGLRVLSHLDTGEMVVAGDLALSGTPVHLKYLQSGYLLVTTKGEGLKVVDVSDRKHPVQVATVKPPGHLQSSTVGNDIYINGRFAYVSHGGGGIYVIDLGDPRHPELLQIIETPGKTKKMVLHGDMLLLADGAEGVYMMDAGKPGRLLPIGSLPTPIIVNEIATVADGILVSNYPGGTLKLPFPEKLEDYRVVSSEEVQVEVLADKTQRYVYLYDERSQNRARLEPRDE